MLGTASHPHPLRSRLRAGLRRHGVWLTILGALVVVQYVLLSGNLGREGDGSPTRIAWRTDFAAALAEAERAGKPMLLDFTAEWCPPCQDMNRETWPDDRVEDAVTAGFIPVMVDIDVPANGEVAARYGVEGIPTLVIARGDGAALHQRVGFTSAEELLAFLQRQVSPAG